MKLIYTDAFGTISWAQRTAYKRFNVTPSEHEDLIDEFGEDNHSGITAAVKGRSTSGFYRDPRWARR